MPSYSEPMSILWTKKLKDHAAFLIPHPPFADGSTNSTMNPLTFIPSFYVLEDFPACLFGILINMKIDFFLVQYRTERFDKGIVIGASFSAERMQHLPTVQELLK